MDPLRKSLLLRICTAIDNKNADEVRILIKQFGGYGVNHKIPNDADGHAPLHKVAKLGAGKKILKLFTETEHVDFNVKDNRGMTALHYVIERKNFEEAHILIYAGADIVTPDIYGKTPLHVMIKKKFQPRLIKLLINMKNGRGENPLFGAVRADNIEITQLLINSGCNIKCVSSNGSTLLHEAVESSIGESHYEVADLLLNSGADVNTKNSWGKTPLFNAVRYRNNKIGQLLLDYGSDINTVDKHGSTVLHQATHITRNDDNLSTIEVLLKNGANVNAEDNNGWTPLHYLVSMEENMYNVKTARLLLDYKADVNIKSGGGRTPLFTSILCKSQRVETVQLLIDYGSDVNCRDNYHLTLLHSAVNYSVDLSILKCLLKNGADADTRDSAGRIELFKLLDKSSLKTSSEDKIKLILKYLDANKKEYNLLDYSYWNHQIDWKIIIQHIAKLQALGVSVNQRILNFISNKTKYRDYFVRCLEELSLAKNSKIKDCWVTFFNILTDNRRKLKNYAGNFGLLKEFEKSDYKDKFPIYGPSMKKNMKKGIERRKLFDRSAGMLSNNWPIFSPTHLIIRDILDCCLSTKDLSKFCEFL